MKERISWTRVVVEGLVIVVSILLALAADAWWDNRQALADEQEALRALQADFLSLRSDLVRWENTYNQRLETTETLFQLADAPQADYPLSDVESAFRTLIVAPTFEPGDRTLEALLNSGRIELIRSPELRALLADWPERVLEIQDGELVAREFIRETLIPTAAQLGIPLTRVYAVDDPEERPRSLVSTEDAIAAYSRVLTDPRFRGLMSYRLLWDRETRWAYGSGVRLLDQILEALDAAIVS